MKKKAGAHLDLVAQAHVEGGEKPFLFGADGLMRWSEMDASI